MEITFGFNIPITLYGLPPSLYEIDEVMGMIKEAGFSTMEMEIEAGNQEYIDGSGLSTGARIWIWMLSVSWLLPTTCFHLMQGSENRHLRILPRSVK